MPTANELLSAEECDDILVVDLDRRTIVIPKSVTVLGVESDDETRILHFQIPRYYCNIDLSEFSIRVNYKNANDEGDLYIVADPTVEDDMIKFDWIVGRHAFARKGNVKFSVTLKDVFEGVVRREFNTTLATLPVLEGMEPDEALTDAVYDYIEQWEESLVGSGDSIKQDIVDKGEEVKADIEDAVLTYVEEHSAELRGPEGDPFTYDDFTEEQLAALIGPTGPQGESITSIKRTSGTGDAGTTDIYTITTSANKTYTFSVYIGADGGGAGDMLKSIYDPQSKNTDIFAYVDEKTANSNHEHNITSMTSLGDNLTGGVDNDTVETWSNLGYGVAWFSELNQLNDQPAQYGFVLNYIHESDIFQIFHDQTDGETYVRSGDNVNNWFQNWRRVIISNGDDYINVGGVNTWGSVTASGGETSMTMFINGIGDGSGNIWIDQAGDAWFKEVHVGSGDDYKMLATEDYVSAAIAAAIGEVIGGSY